MTYIYNVAIRRKDGKVESDTVYSDHIIKRPDVEKFCVQHDCSAIFEPVGTVCYFGHDDLGLPDSPKSIEVITDLMEVSSDESTIGQSSPIV